MGTSRDSSTISERFAFSPKTGEKPAGTEPRAGRTTKVVVATSVMLTFISFWRAAAIVLCDLGSSAFYVGGIAEHAIGEAAPWFILGVVCFSYAVRAIYIESCAMFTRGGVYRVVKEAMGGTLAKLSVSALMFDYILTGPISGVSAGQYVVGLAAQGLNYVGYAWQPSKETTNLLAAFVAVLVTVYFWWRNTQGIHESSGDALRIMYVTTAMVVIMILWSSLTIIKQVATISGLIFTAGLFTLFTVSQRMALASKETTGLDEFSLVPKETIDVEGLQLRPAPVIVAVRDHKNLKPLAVALEQTDAAATDVVVMTARIMPGAAAGYREIYQEHLFTDYEQILFTGVVALAEKAGKPVKLLTVSSNNPYSAIVNTAVQLGAARVYTGTSAKLTGDDQARMVGDIWERNPAPDKAQFDLILVSPDGLHARYEIGAHAPDLSPDDIDLIHRLWLELSAALPRVELHHQDVVTLALQHLQRQFEGPAKAGILSGIRRARAREPKGQHGPGMLQARTRARGDTHMLTPLMELKSQARGVMRGTRTLEKRGDRRRRDEMLSFWGTVLSFCIPPILLIGVIWNPIGVQGAVLMALLAVLVLIRLGIALAKIGTIRRRDRPRVPETAPEQAAAWKPDRSLQSLHAR